MSGPIVRKYGFPNFEKIFGRRDVQHGVEDEGATAEAGPGLPPDLEKSATPTDPTKPESAGQMARPTEFGSAVE
jgi:hypothetical protein